MKNIIIIPFHIGDFLGGTMHMDNAEIGAYMLLLIAHYQAGENGLPDDDNKLMRIARVSFSKWRFMRPILSEKFIINNGRWINLTVVKCLFTITKKSEQAQANALKRYNTPSADASNPQCNPLTLNLKPLEEEEERKKEIEARAPLPEWIPVDAWNGFLEMRKKIKKPLTERAIKLTISNLEKLRDAGNDPAGVLDQSTQRNWSGVFPLKEQSHHGLFENKLSVSPRNSIPSKSDRARASAREGIEE